MAEAVIALRAVDQTRQAFLSVQQSLAKLQGAIGKAGTAIGGFLTLQLARRALLGFTNSLREVERDSQKFGASADELNKVTRATAFLDSIMKGIRTTVMLSVDGFLRLKDAIFGVSKVESASIADKFRTERDAEKIRELTKEIEDLQIELAAVGEKPAEHFMRLADAIESAQEAADDPSFSRFLNEQMREKEALKLSIEQRKIAVKSFEDYQKSVAAVDETFADFKAKQMTAEEQQILLTNSIIQTTNRIKELQKVLPEEFIPEFATAEQIQAMNQLVIEHEKLNRELAKREILETTIEKIAKQSGEIISQSLEDAIFAGQRLSEVLRALAQDLLRMAFREAVTAPLGTGLGSFFKNLFRAEGGPVASGSPYIVGERGPELFVPRSSGSIVSNDNLSGMAAGGGGINITYNIASGVSRAELGSLLEMERRRLKSEIPDMVRRGGAYRAAFA